MEARINNGNGYLYCKVDTQVSNYQQFYNSSEECIADITPKILEECKERGYTEEETEKVITHYEILFNNASGEWSDIYETI